MKDIIQLDNQNRCVSANCVYSDSDITVEYEFSDEDSRMKFFNDIQNYVYRNGEFIYDKLPNPDPQPTQQDLINADIYMQLAQLQMGVMMNG